MKKFARMISLVLTISLMITCTLNGVAFAQGVEKPFTSIAFDTDRLTLDIGGTDTLEAQTQPQDSDDILNWQSTDETVATVEDGKITALRSGTTDIIASSSVNPVVLAKLTLTVNKPVITTTGRVIDESAAVYDSMSSGKKTLGTLEKEAEFEVITAEVAAGWHKIYYDGYVAYISASAVQLREQNVPASLAKAESGGLGWVGLYNGTGSDKKLIMNINRGIQFDVVKRNAAADWHQVYYDGYLGYVYAPNMYIHAKESDAQQTGMVIGTTATIYNTTTAAQRSIATLAKGTELKVITANAVSGWHKVYYKGYEGYVKAANVAIQTTKPQAIATAESGGLGWVGLYNGTGSDKKLIMNINRGIQFDVVKRNAAADWHQVYYDGYLGYVYAPNMYIHAKESDAQQTGMVIGTTATIYNTTTAAQRSIATLAKGTELKVITANAVSGWHKVYYNGIEGYVKASETAVKTAKPKIVATAESGGLGWVGLYNGTGSNKTLIMNINKGITFDVVKLNAAADWHQVYYDGYLGYVYAPNMYIHADEQDATATGMIIGAGVTVYNTTTAAQRSVGTLAKDSTVKVLTVNAVSGWHKIYYNGYEGYVKAANVALQAASKPAVVATAESAGLGWVGLYNAGGSDRTLIMNINRGIQFEITKLNAVSGWHQVYYNGYLGYVSAANVYIHAKEDDAKNSGVIIGSNATVYNTNISGQRSMGTLAVGSEVKVITANAVSGWHKIYYNGYEGYVKAANVAVRQTSAPATVATAEPCLGWAGLYNTASSSRTLIKNIYKGETFKIVKLNAATGWHQVYYDGFIGYVYAPNMYVKADVQSATGEGLAIRTNGTPVYNCTISAAKVMGTLPSGTEIKVIQKNAASGWHKIYYNGYEGYVKASESAIKSTSGPTAVAKAQSANLGWVGLYNGTGSSRYLIMNINKGIEFSITKLNAATGWHQVYYNGYLGYVYAPNVYIKASSSQATATGKAIRTDGTPVYNTTLSGGRVMGTLTSGTEIKVIQKNAASGWHKIYYNGYEGYVKASESAIKTSAPATVATAEPCLGWAGLYNATGSTRYVITNINKGTKFNITKLNAATGWHQVYYDGYLGYVYAPNMYVHADKGDVTTSGLAIRTNGTPVYNCTISAAKVMATLPSGTALQVIQKNAASGWHKIYYNGFEGYVKASESAIKTSAPATVATAQSANLGWVGLYNGTGSSRYLIMNISKGVNFSITKLNAATGWHQVYYNGYLGYVYAPNVYIKASSSQVTATGIVIQSGGSALYNTTISGKRVMTTLPRYTELKIIKKNSPSGWHKVYYNGFEGYIPSSYTAVRVSSKPTITTTGKLKYQSGLYNNTGSGNKIIWSIAAGTKVEIIQANYISGWHQVYYDGFVGYIKTSNVTLSSSMMDRFRAALTVLDTESEKSAVHVRKSPSTSAESLGLIYGQTVGVTVIENYSNGWSKIKGITYANKSVTGYVKTMYLKQVFPNAAMSVHIDIAKQRLYIYDKNGNLIRSMKCSTGTAGNDTPTGDYLIGGRKPYFISGLMTAEKAVRFNGGIYIHRVPYYTDRPGSYDRAISQLGKKASHGCVRVPIADSTWIYDNLPKGSKVVVTD